MIYRLVYELMFNYVIEKEFVEFCKKKHETFIISIDYYHICTNLFQVIMPLLQETFMHMRPTEYLLNPLIFTLNQHIFGQIYERSLSMDIAKNIVQYSSWFVISRF